MSFDLKYIFNNHEGYVSIYKMDEDNPSCFIRSKKPRPTTPGIPLATFGNGRYLGDEHFVREFFELKRLIKNHREDHSPLAAKVASFLDVNAQFVDSDGDKESYTLLDVACRKGCTVCAQILLGKGADPDIQSSRGRTARSIANDSGNPELQKLFKTQDLPDNDTAVEHTVVCELTFSPYSSFPQFKGTIKLGESHQDDLSIILELESQTDLGPLEEYPNKVRVSYTLTQTEYKGKKAFKLNITYPSNTTFHSIIPNYSKYAYPFNEGKDTMIVELE